MPDAPVDAQPEEKAIDYAANHAAHLARGIQTVLSDPASGEYQYCIAQCIHEHGGPHCGYRMSEEEVKAAIAIKDLGLFPILNPAASGESNPPETKGFTVDEFRAHIGRLVELYVEEATENDPDWLADLEGLPKGALDFALFVDALGGEETTLCAHGRPKTKRCERCVNEGVYTYAQPQMQPETNLARWEDKTKGRK